MIFMQRKKFLQSISIAAVAAAIPFPASAKENKKKKYFTVAHLTDTHVKPDPVAEDGMRKAFRHANALNEKPAFIINGGDAIMDGMAASKEKTAAQWQVWKKILSEENHLPIYHCLGNHDAWGWQLKEPEVKQDPLYDKAWALQEHKMDKRFYSFTKQHWKFIVLDSAHENNGGYIARIDDEQFNWLENELKNTDTSIHVCIVSHIPIVSFCAALFAEKNQDNGDWRISRALLHTDARRLKALFRSYKNIRCCISGHIHLQDEVKYLGIKYFCNGAVSGNWWKGAFQEFDPAYALLKYYEDGTAEREFINY